MSVSISLSLYLHDYTVVQYATLPLPYYHHASTVPTLKTPIEQRPKMIEAIAKEIHDLCSIGAFELVPMPDRARPIDSRIVLKVKYRADGAYDKHKARLVARGFLARLGVDFFSTFSPMASLTAVRMMFSLAVNQGFDIWHCDIPQAFIQSQIR